MLLLTVLQYITEPCIQGLMATLVDADRQGSLQVGVFKVVGGAGLCAGFPPSFFWPCVFCEQQRKACALTVECRVYAPKRNRVVRFFRRTPGDGMAGECRLCRSRSRRSTKSNRELNCECSTTRSAHRLVCPLLKVPLAPSRTFPTQNIAQKSPVPADDHLFRCLLLLISFSPQGAVQSLRILASGVAGVGYGQIFSLGVSDAFEEAFGFLVPGLPLFCSAGFSVTGLVVSELRPRRTRVALVWWMGRIIQTRETRRQQQQQECLCFSCTAGRS